MQTTQDFFDGRARLIAIEGYKDGRGLLLSADFAQLPFEPRRVFTVSNVPEGSLRGGHAHRVGEQLLVCLQGRISILMRYGEDTKTQVLEPDSPGLLIGAGVWSEQTYITAGSVLLVLASHPYDPQSYTAHWSGGEPG